MNKTFSIASKWHIATLKVALCGGQSATLRPSKWHIAIVALLAMLPVTAAAQSGTNSPYSQYGLGVLSDQSQGFSRGMNGVGIGLRKGNVANTLNPASYSAVDSLTMIFDVGLSGQVTNFKEGGRRLNANNADFEYAVGSFRLRPGLGVGFGILPYTNIGYQYATPQFLDRTNGSVVQTYSGSGGLHQAFIGAGWRVVRPLSVGVSLAYMWGTYSKSVVSSSTTYINSLIKNYSASVNSYKVDLGLQYQLELGKSDAVTIGATVGIGHKLGADPRCDIIKSDSQTSLQDTTSFVVADGLRIPMAYGLGAMWTHGQRWTVGADFTLQKWGSVKHPGYTDDIYALRSDLLKDRTKLSVGADYVPNAMSRRFLQRVHYRFGAGYATPYYNVNGKDGPRELSVSAGLGLPLQNAYNNRSVLNVSAQWVNTSADGLITENMFRINVGLTFNERWFMKWKID